MQYFRPDGFVAAKPLKKARVPRVRMLMATVLRCYVPKVMMGLVCAAVGVAIRNSHIRRIRRARDEAGAANGNQNGIAHSLLVMLPVTLFGVSPKSSEVGGYHDLYCHSTHIQLHCAHRETLAPRQNVLRLADLGQLCTAIVN